MHDAEFTIHDYFGLGLIKKFKRPMGVNKRCNDFAALAPMGTAATDFLL